MPKYTVELLSDDDMQWFVETAAVNMLRDEVKAPQYVDVENLYMLASMGALGKTAFIAKRDGVPVGALGALLLPNLYNPKIMNLTEVFWYVLPEHRNTRAGLMLLNAFIDCADKLADESTLSLLSTSQVNNETLGRKGYQMAEIGFRAIHGGK